MEAFQALEKEEPNGERNIADDPTLGRLAMESWAAVLAQVLTLSSIDFLQLAGLLGVRAGKDGRVDYQEFLEKYQPQHEGQCVILRVLICLGCREVVADVWMKSMTLPVWPK